MRGDRINHDIAVYKPVKGVPVGIPGYPMILSGRALELAAKARTA